MALPGFQGFGDFGFGSLPGFGGRASALPPVSPEEEAGFWESLGSTALTGLGWLGGTLDKTFGGRALRGLLGGKPEELLSLIPFSDTLGITDPENVVRGHDLLGAPDADFLSPEGLGGLGAEILLDPATYLSFGGTALTKLGKAARKGAILPRSTAARTAGLAGSEAEDLARLVGNVPSGPMPMSAIDEVAGKPLGYGTGFSVPFSGMDPIDLSWLPGAGVPGFMAPAAAYQGLKAIPGANYLTDPLEAAARGVGNLATDVWKGSIQPLFRSAVREQSYDPLIQSAEAITEAMPKARAAAWEQSMPAIDDFINYKFGGDKEAFLARSAGHLTDPDFRWYNDLMEGVVQPANDIERQMFERFHNPLEESMQALQSRGVPAMEKRFEQLPGTQIELQMAPRSMEEQLRAPVRGASPNMVGKQKGRVEHTFGLSRNMWNDLSLENVDGLNELQIRDVIGQKYLSLPDANQLGAFRAQASQGNTAARSALEHFEPRIKQAEILGRLKANGHIGNFNPAVLDYINKNIRDAGNILKADVGIHRSIAAMADVGIADGVPITQALQDAGLALDGNAMEATRAALRKMGKQADQYTDATGRVIDPLHGLMIPKEGHAGLVKMMGTMQGPEGLAPFLEVVDGVTNWTKTFQTILWPANQIRNALSALFQSWIHGAADPTAQAGLGYIKPILDARKLRAGSVLEDAHLIPAFKGMSPEEATQALQREIVKWDVPHRAGQLNREANPADKLRDFIPGLKQPTLGESLGKLRAPLSEWAQPHAVSGGVGFNKAEGLHRFTDDIFPMAKAGREVATNIDDTFRIGNFVAYLRQGYVPEEAMKMVQAAQYNYCVDEATQILTRDGWKNLDELSAGDDALALDPKTRQIKWETISAVNVFESPGSLVRLKTNRFDALTTMNHRWLAEGSGMVGGHWTIRDGFGVGTHSHFMTTHELVEGSAKQLIVGGGLPVDEVKTPLWSDEFVELAGWVIAEGTFHTMKTQKANGVFVFQSETHNPIYVKRLEELSDYFRAQGATATQHKPRRYTNDGIIRVFYFGKGIASAIRRAIPDKQLTPEFLCSLTPRQLHILYDSLMKGDGTTTNGGTNLWAQKCRGRLNGFQMLCAMLGKRTHSRLAGEHGCSIVTVYQTGTLYTSNLKPTFEEYHGRVWCPTTASGTWMARRNGKTYWTGNSNLSRFERGVVRRLAPFFSWTRQNVPAVVKELIEQPGGKMAQTIRGMNVGRGQTPGFVPGYIGEGAAVQVGGEQDGKQTFLSQLGLPFEDIGQLTSGAGPFGMLNPLLKFPLEQAVGKQLYTGRDLRDTYTMLPHDLMGVGLQPVENAIMNSPFGRAWSTTRTLLDPNKSWGQAALSLGTGARLNTVDMEQARNLALRNQADAMLRGQPGVGSFQRLYVNPENLGQLSPEEQMLYGVYQQQERRRRAQR